MELFVVQRVVLVGSLVDQLDDETEQLLSLYLGEELGRLLGIRQEEKWQVKQSVSGVSEIKRSHDGIELDVFFRWLVQLVEELVSLVQITLQSV